MEGRRAAHRGGLGPRVGRHASKGKDAAERWDAAGRPLRGETPPLEAVPLPLDSVERVQAVLLPVLACC